MDPSSLYFHKIDTERHVPTVDSGGSPVETFSTNLVNISCNVQPIKGEENQKAGRLEGKSTIKIYLSDTHNISYKDKIVYRSNRYDVVEILPYPDPGNYQKIIAVQTDNF